jgi:long-chain acyl-CoA synthetase
MQGEMLMNETHLARMIHDQIKKYGEKTAVRYREGGVWKEMSWKAMGEQIRAVSKGLLEMNIKEGDMVALFSQNRPEWNITDYGILAIRGVSVPVYATNTAKQTEYIVNETEAGVIFAGSQDQYDKVSAFSHTSPHLKKIIVFDSNVRLNGGEKSMYFKDFIETGRSSAKDHELEKRLREASIEDLATLIYTSGTTGEPKGVMLHHSTFHYSFLAHLKRLDTSDQDVSLCFLPLSHVFERTWCFFAAARGMVIGYCDDTAKVIECMQEIKPTVMCAVPRFYEKMYSAVFEKLEKASPSKKKLFLWAVKTGEQMYQKKKEKEPLPLILKLKHLIADGLVLKKIRSVVGGRLRFFPCAGAQLSKEIEEFFHSVGLFITYGYGLTETTATVTCHERYHFRPGTVGKPIDGVEVRIAENGEILVKGETVTKGYYKKPEATAESFENGWFKTGDVGVLEDGYLTITERIKDLMKSSGGKYIAPQLIETTIGKDHYIEQITVIGDARKFVSALIVPAFDALADYARTHNISYSSREDLIENPRIIQFYQQRIAEHSKELAGHEQIRKFTLLPTPFTQEAGEITPTMKLKRKFVTDKFQDIINKMYLEK